jgi:hypothetical protein
LVYSVNTDENKAKWVSYDAAPDSWTSRIFGSNPRKQSDPAYTAGLDRPVLTNVSWVIATEGAESGTIVAMRARPPTSHGPCVSITLPLKVHPWSSVSLPDIPFEFGSPTPLRACLRSRLSRRVPIIPLPLMAATLPWSHGRWTCRPDLFLGRALWRTENSR